MEKNHQQAAMLIRCCGIATYRKLCCVRVNCCGEVAGYCFGGAYGGAGSLAFFGVALLCAGVFYFVALAFFYGGDGFVF